MTGSTAFSGKVAIVTGGASGIGFATARLLAAQGANVAISDLKESVVAAAVEKITRAGGSAIGIAADVTDVEAVASAAGKVAAAFEKIDILVNSAGIFYNGPAEDVTPGDWRRTLAINLDGVFNWSQAVARASMLARQSGSIINVASVAGLVAGPGSAPYTASKHGVVGLTKALAIDWGPFGIRVNAICPGLTETEMVRDAWKGREAAYADRLARIPSGLSSSPEDQAHAILFLASDLAAAVNGLIMNVDGGTVALSSGYTVTRRPPK